MEIKINVDESKFKDIVENELAAFSKEELHEILRDGIVHYMKEDNNIRHIFVLERYDRWSNKDEEYCSSILKEAAKTFDLSPVYKEINDYAVEYIKNNLNEIINKQVTEMFLNGLRNKVFNSSEFEYALSQALAKRNNNTF